MITIENDNSEIISSNYWLTEWAKKGIMAASLNAGTFRVLLPDSMKDMVIEMKTGKEIIISKGQYQGRIAYEILFDDHTKSPFSLIIGDNQIFSLQVADSEQGKALMVAVWMKGPKKVFEMPARFRVVDKLPCLKAWGK